MSSAPARLARPRRAPSGSSEASGDASSYTSGSGWSESDGGAARGRAAARATPTPRGRVVVRRQRPGPLRRRERWSEPWTWWARCRPARRSTTSGARRRTPGTTLRRSSQGSGSGSGSRPPRAAPTPAATTWTWATRASTRARRGRGRGHRRRLARGVAWPRRAGTGRWAVGLQRPGLRLRARRPRCGRRRHATSPARKGRRCCCRCRRATGSGHPRSTNSETGPAPRPPASTRPQPASSPRHDRVSATPPPGSSFLSPPVTPPPTPTAASAPARSSSGGSATRFPSPPVSDQSGTEGAAVSLPPCPARTPPTTRRCTWTESGLPPGLGIDPNTGVISRRALAGARCTAASPSPVTATDAGGANAQPDLPVDGRQPRLASP